MAVTETATGGFVTCGESDDHERVTAMYDAHVRDVYRYVHRMCLDHAVAEDVTQDVFLALLGRSTAEISVGWLMRSARNRLIDIVRREANYRDKLRVLKPRSLESATDEMGTVIEDLRMREALENLRPDHRIVLMLHYVDGSSVAELADALGRSYKGAEGLLSRARAALRAELGEEQ
ncbi:MAG: RNA polymerase sigma factor [Acidimicrobiales bacterium]